MTTFDAADSSFTAKAGWLGLKVGGHLASSVHSLNDKHTQTDRHSRAE